MDVPDNCMMFNLYQALNVDQQMYLTKLFIDAFFRQLPTPSHHKSENDEDICFCFFNCWAASCWSADLQPSMLQTVCEEDWSHYQVSW